jgi:hypothetical protein
MVWKPRSEDYEWQFESLCRRQIFLVIRASQQRHASGDDNIGEVQCLTFQGKIPMSGLNWLYLTMVLLNALF